MNDYYKNLPRKYMGSGALFFDSGGKVLIVKPTYKDYWEIPGGMVEKDESPWQACMREIKEELSFDIGEQKLLSVDYVTNTDDRGDRLMWIFDGGLLNEGQITQIKLPEKELSEYRFVTAEEAAQLLGNRLKIRIPNSMKAREMNTILYLENGEPIKS